MSPPSKRRRAPRKKLGNSCQQDTLPEVDAQERPATSTLFGACLSLIDAENQDGRNVPGSCRCRKFSRSGKVRSGTFPDEHGMPEQIDFPLPLNLPRPINDGAADHLEGMPLPQVYLRSTAGRMIDCSNLGAPRAVLYCYPLTGVPGQQLPQGWDEIPGARGCTPQTCGFRDRHQELWQLKATLFGLSTQTTEYQHEMAGRLRLPFAILSDSEFKLCDALRLPTFDVNGMRLLKRLTLITRIGQIEHVFYPVFPPDKNADQVLRWLRDHRVPD